jgi:hypothetical protein
MIPIYARKPKPTRVDVTKDETFQDLVGGWLASNAHATLNRRHSDGKPDLVSGNDRHIRALVLLLDKVAAQEFSGDTTSGPQEVRGTYRLDLDRIYASNERRAKWVIEHWDRSKVEGRSQGGKHGTHDGTRKGPVPRWTAGDLLPYWGLPARGRAKAVTEAKTGMSLRTYYMLAKRMPDLLARMELERLAWETIRPDLDRLLP